MAITRAENFEQVPINIVGSSTFGRYPKISLEKTYNMFISDNFLVDYAGYESTILNGFESLGANGRALYASNVFDFLVAVVSNAVYIIRIIYNPTLTNPYQFVPTQVGILDSYSTDVYIAENNNNQILISDQQNLYVVQPITTPLFQTLTAASLGFTPGYISFHDGRFLCASRGTNNWRLSNPFDPSAGTTVVFPNAPAFIGPLQVKPDTVQAVVPVPSRGNMVLVFGENVAEAWFDTGGQLFPYTPNLSFNIDYGCANPSTIAFTDEVIVWLATNEKSGPVIMISDGGTPRKISTDGIDFVLSNLANPASAEAFIYRQDGHLFYHINFIQDNLSLFCDLSNEERFFHASDENGNYFIAKQVAFLNNQYYFVSRNNGNLYAFDTLYTTYDGAEIPRIRVCKHIRLPTQDYFILNDLGFTIEQGETEPQPTGVVTNFLVTQDGKFLITQDGNSLVTQDSGSPLYVNPRVDLSLSYDGGASFNSYVPYELNSLGNRINKLLWWQLGMSNDIVPQFRFWGLGRFVATDGIANIRI